MTYPTLHDVPFPLCRDGVAARTSCWAVPARAAERGIRRDKRTQSKSLVLLEETVIDGFVVVVAVKPEFWNYGTMHRGFLRGCVGDQVVNT